MGLLPAASAPGPFGCEWLIARGHVSSRGICISGISSLAVTLHEFLELLRVNRTPHESTPLAGEAVANERPAPQSKCCSRKCSRSEHCRVGLCKAEKSALYDSFTLAFWAGHHNWSLIWDYLSYLTPALTSHASIKRCTSSWKSRRSRLISGALCSSPSATGPPSTRQM
jgi:hypothetical protein